MKLVLPIVFVALLGVVCVPAIRARGAESSNPWPQWQGPKRDNVSTETGLLKQWPNGGPPLAWKAKGLGGGFATVSVTDGKIFTQGDQSDGCYVEALDLNGKMLWKTKIGKTGGGGGYPGPRAQPTVSGENLVALGQYGDLVCINPADGAVRWHKIMVSDFKGKMMSGWGYAESPLIDGDRVICTPGGSEGTMTALELKTGNPIWRTQGVTDAAAYSSPVVAEIGGKKQYVQLTGESVLAVSPDDGKVLWKVARHGGTAVITTPIVSGNDVFVTSAYGAGCNLFQVSPTQDGAFSVKQVYADPKIQNRHGGAILINGYVYTSSDPGILTCLELKTGKVKWKDRSIGKGCLAYAEGKLYLRAESSGTVALIDATPEGYHLVSQFDQPDRSDAMAWPHPVIADGKLYLRDQDVLLCYDVRQK